MSNERPRLRLLVVNSSIILAQLRWAGFRRMDLESRSVNNADQMIAALSGDGPLPDAVVLEFCPITFDAFSLCKRIRRELGLTQLPLVVISKTSISHNLLARINESGCNEVMTAPLSPGQLHFVLCKYLKMPKRCEERLAVAGPVTVEGDETTTGQVRDVSARGARIQLPETFEVRPGQQVRCNFGPEPQMQVDARVIWRRKTDCGSELAVQFTGVPEGLVNRLENLATWRLEPAEGHQLVILHQNLTEASNFTELLPQLDETIVFDLRQVAMINSMGVSHWITLLRQLDDKGISYSHSHCSIAFCTQANYIAEMLGKGKILSFYIPLECPNCAREVERLVEADQIAEPAAPELPQFDCPGCGETLLFADMPSHFFQFLAAR